MELDHIEAATRMVERGLRVARLPGTRSPTRSPRARFAESRFVGAHPIRRRIVAVARTAPAEPSAALDPFCRLLERIPELVSDAQRMSRDK